MLRPLTVHGHHWIFTTGIQNFKKSPPGHDEFIGAPRNKLKRNINHLINIEENAFLFVL